MKIFKSIAIVAMLSVSGQVFSQNTEHQYLTWLQNIVKVHPDSKLSYEGILQVRMLENLDNVQLVSLTNSVFFKPGHQPIFLGADYTFVGVNTPDGHHQVHWIQPKLEYRPQLGTINLLFRLMYAHLWTFDLKESGYKSEDDRIRFLYQISFPLSKDLRMNANDELFVLGRQSFMRENRFQLSIAKKLDEKNTISAGYFFRWLGTTDEVQKTVYENALTVGYTYTIPSKDKKAN